MLLVKNNIGHQALVARNILEAGTMVCRTAVGLAPPHLPGSMRKPRSFTLVVNAPEELDVAVRQVANQIPSLVQARSRHVAKGIGNERKRSNLVEVASSQSSATNVQFAGDTDGNWLHLGVQHIDLCVGERATDGLAVALGRPTPSTKR